MKTQYTTFLNALLSSLRFIFSVFILFITGFVVMGQTPVVFKDINPNGHGIHYYNALKEVNNLLFFAANDGNAGTELWTTDGSSGNTKLVKDIFLGSNSGLEVACCKQFLFVELGDKLIFEAINENGKQLWVSDGTEIGTFQLTNEIDFDPVEIYTHFNDKLIFVSKNHNANGELWVTDGTVEGTIFLNELRESFQDYHPYWLTNFKDKVFFNGIDNLGDVELWATDGTLEGTSIFKNINLDNGSYPAYFFVCNNQMFFGAAADTINGYELWVSDGTVVGTSMLKDINSGNEASYFSSFFKYNDQIFFSANDGIHGHELWKSDGTTQGTQLVKDINPGINDSYPFNFFEFKGQLIFTPTHIDYGQEFWVTDGTEVGTKMIDDYFVGTSSASSGFVDYNVINVDGFEQLITTGANELGKELVSIDLDLRSVNLVKDINEGEAHSFPDDFFTFNNTLYSVDYYESVIKKQISSLTI